MSVELDKRFSRFLSRHRGQVIIAEDFRRACKLDEPAGGWQRAMSSLVTRARIAGRLRSAGVGRDHHRSYKTKWRVVA